MKKIVVITIVLIQLLACQKEEHYPELIEGCWYKVKGLDEWWWNPIHHSIKIEEQKYTRYLDTGPCTFLNEDVIEGPVSYSISGNELLLEFEDGHETKTIDKLTKDRLILNSNKYRRCD